MPRLLFLAVFTASAVHAASIFGGSATFDHTFVNNVFTLDLSNLQIADTPTGLTISGSFSGTTTGSGSPDEIVSVLYITGVRPLAVDDLTSINVSTHLSVRDITTSPGIHVYQMGTVAGIAGGSGFGCERGGPPGGFTGSDSNTHFDVVVPFAIGPYSAPCQFSQLRGDNRLVAYAYATISVANTAGSFTIDFGNSLTGDAVLANAVPEPASYTYLVFGIVCAVMFRHSRSN